MNKLWDRYPKPSELFKIYDLSVKKFKKRTELYFPLGRIWVNIDPTPRSRIIRLASCLVGGKAKLIRDSGTGERTFDADKKHSATNLLGLHYMLKEVRSEREYDRLIELLKDPQIVSIDPKRTERLCMAAAEVRPNDPDIASGARRTDLPIDQIDALSKIVLQFLREGRADSGKFRIEEIEQFISSIYLRGGQPAKNKKNYSLQIIKVLSESPVPVTTRYISDKLSPRVDIRTVAEVLSADYKKCDAFFIKLSPSQRKGRVPKYWALAVETEKYEDYHRMP